jgi:hypothetical protein
MYSYVGNYGDNTDLYITSSGPVTGPHYKIELIVWTLFIDSWAGSEVQFKLVGAPEVNKFYKNSSVLNSTLCEDGGGTEGFQRLSMSFTHTDEASVVSFRVQTAYTGGNPLLGIGDLLLIAHSCHSYCLTCTGAANNQCPTCKNTVIVGTNTTASQIYKV